LFGGLSFIKLYSAADAVEIIDLRGASLGINLPKLRIM
jgi:hypothetical protein